MKKAKRMSKEERLTRIVPAPDWMVTHGIERLKRMAEGWSAEETRKMARNLRKQARALADVARTKEGVAA